tara:strand:- start:1753 stop:3786 length:2034 start_codon:yes stop_codon:yes gene_type:complete
MATFYKSNPMPTSGAIFVTNPRRRRRRNAWFASKEDLRVKLDKNGDPVIRHGEVVMYHPAHSEAAKSSDYASRGKVWAGTQAGKAAKKIQKATVSLRNLLPKTSKGSGRGLITKDQIKEIIEKKGSGATSLFKKLKADGDGRTNKSKQKALENIANLLKEEGIKLSAAQKAAIKPKRKSKKVMKSNKEKGMLAFSNPRRRRRNAARKRKRNGLAMVRKNALKLNRRKKRRNLAKKKNAGHWSKAKFKAALRNGKSMKQAHKLARRKNAVKVNRKRKRKNSTSKRRRRNAIRLNKSAGKFNPRRRRNSISKYRRRRRNQAQPVVNVALGAVEGIQKKAQGFPLVSFVAFAITPLALGAGVYYVHKAVEPVLMPALKPLAKFPLVGAVVKNPYLTTGLVVGLGLNLLAGTKMGKKVISQKVAAQVGGLAVAMGVGLDLSLKSFAQAATEVAQEVAPELAAQDVVAAQDAMALDDAVALDALEAAEAEAAVADAAVAAAATNGDLSGYGDGGFYMIGANSQDLGALASDFGALASEYGDARNADAFVCTPVMHPSEASAAVAGAPFWRKKFGKSPKRLRGQRTRRSRHAGRMGHRYGWLIKKIGFKRFQEIAALPASKRAAVIRSFQQKAQAAEPVQQAQIAAQAQLAETASMPVAGAANGAQGFSGVGYGALMFSGAGY